MLTTANKRKVKTWPTLEDFEEKIARRKVAPPIAGPRLLTRDQIDFSDHPVHRHTTPYPHLQAIGEPTQRNHFMPVVLAKDHMLPVNALKYWFDKEWFPSSCDDQYPRLRTPRELPSRVPARAANETQGIRPAFSYESPWRCYPCKKRGQTCVIFNTSDPVWDGYEGEILLKTCWGCSIAPLGPCSLTATMSLSRRFEERHRISYDLATGQRCYHSTDICDDFIYSDDYDFPEDPRLKSAVVLAQYHKRTNGDAIRNSTLIHNALYSWKPVSSSARLEATDDVNPPEEDSSASRPFAVFSNSFDKGQVKSHPGSDSFTQPEQNVTESRGPSTEDPTIASGHATSLRKPAQSTTTTASPVGRPSAAQTSRYESTGVLTVEASPVIKLTPSSSLSQGTQGLAGPQMLPPSQMKDKRSSLSVRSDYDSSCSTINGRRSAMVRCRHRFESGSTTHIEHESCPPFNIRMALSEYRRPVIPYKRQKRQPEDNARSTWDLDASLADLKSLLAGFHCKEPLKIIQIERMKERLGQVFLYVSQIAAENGLSLVTSKDKLLSSISSEGSWSAQKETVKFWQSYYDRLDPMTWLLRDGLWLVEKRSSWAHKYPSFEFFERIGDRASWDWSLIIPLYANIILREATQDHINPSMITLTEAEDQYHDLQRNIQTLASGFTNHLTGHPLKITETHSYCTIIKQEHCFDTLILSFTPGCVNATIYQPLKSNKKGFIQSIIMGFIGNRVQVENCNYPEIHFDFTKHGDGRDDHPRITNNTSSGPLTCLILDTWIKTPPALRAQTLGYKSTGIQDSTISPKEEGRLRWAIWKVFEREREVCEKIIGIILYSEKYLGLKR